jgi:hypothetical protein
MIMDSNTNSLLVLALILVFCCGPMLFMMFRIDGHGQKQGDDQENCGATKKLPGEKELK